ncbi:hypothetical protein P7K49_026912 [Saguinus oedipus]|uniref:Uncharacterized protein n=1 Tax=Saguinus oedipus TaxID=9490 RepID=A0ABQ9UF20_SAGOE|nr:hypothetical protein P7K49_026912 [Saguinus oedipus]
MVPRIMENVVLQVTSNLVLQQNQPHIARLQEVGDSGSGLGVLAQGLVTGSSDEAEVFCGMQLVGLHGGYVACVDDRKYVIHKEDMKTTLEDRAEGRKNRQPECLSYCSNTLWAACFRTLYKQALDSQRPWGSGNAVQAV